MKSILALAAVLLWTSDALRADTLVLTNPLDYQVIQRDSKESGRVHLRGSLTVERDRSATSLEAKITGEHASGTWQKITADLTSQAFDAEMPAPAGGWYRLQVRALSASGASLAEVTVEHVGVGEVFVVTGQSNSANHGSEKQTTHTGRASSCDGNRWQLANDPQPGASGKGGSFMPPFADAIVEKFDVPVGIVACGIGATSVREWLPAGTIFPNPPTLVGRVKQLPDGSWESKGHAYDMLVSRMKQLGPHGFRAVLWHQGESDANQRDPLRTLPGLLYRKYLEMLIRSSRHDIGWEAPWFVAQASYHVPGDESSPDIRAAQASLWKDGIALEGPDTDQLKGNLRERDGKGVHFAGPGLREHAQRWAEKVAPWLETQLK